MLISIDDAVQLQSLARTDPFGAGSMYKDPSAAAASQVSDMTAKLDSISSFPGLDSSLQGQFAGLSSAMSGYTGGISSTIADRMGTFSKDTTTVAGEIDLYDSHSPCGIINSAHGSMAIAGDMIHDAIAGVKKILAPVTAIMGDIFDAAHELTTEALGAIHSAMSAIGSAISSAVAYMSQKLAEFRNLVAGEIAAIGKMFGNLVDLSYFDKLRKEGIEMCGENVAKSVKA